MNKLGEISAEEDAWYHELLEVLMIALAASVCGTESLDEFSAFGERRLALLRDFLRLKNGMPDRATFGRLFDLLDPAGTARSFEAFLDDLGAAGDGARAIDAPTLRRSFELAAARSPLHVRIAFGASDQIAIARRARPRADDEADATRTLLRILTLDGLLVIGNPGEAWPETAALVHERGGDWLFALNADGPDAQHRLQALFTDACDAFDVADRRHGPDASGRFLITRRNACLPSDPRCVVAYVQQIPTDDRGAKAGTISPADRYYVASAGLTPESIAHAARAAARIEDDRHWLLVPILGETRARVRRAMGAENHAILDRIALGLLHRSRPRMSLARKRRRSQCSDTFARTIIGQMR